MPSQQPSKPNLGRLEKVDVTQYWQSAAADFAPWLSLDENMQLLGESIGLELEVVLDAEQMADRQADLLCRDAKTQGWVLIGSQLSPTDEQHFGQLLTEGAGINPFAVVWIASQFSPEHLTVLNWLNQNTQDHLRFFGVEIELWQIGKTAMAAQFNLATSHYASTLSIESPLPAESPLEIESLLEEVDELSPENHQSDHESEDLSAPEPLTEVQQQNLAFWTDLCDQLEQRGSVVKAVTPPSEKHIDFAIGRAGFRLSARLLPKQKTLHIELRLLDEDAHAYYGLLLEQKAWIESEMGFPLIWDNHASECAIFCTLPDVVLNKSDKWSDYIDWLCGGLECFHLTFADLVQSLNADNYHAFPHYDDPMQNVLSLPS